MVKKTSISVDAPDVGAFLDRLLVILERAGKWSLLAGNDLPSTFGQVLGDAVIEFQGDRGPYWILLEVKSRAWPSDIEAAALQARHLARARFGDRGVAVLAAPKISEEAAEVCRRLEISWIDEAGNCDIAFPGVWVQVRGNPHSQKPEKANVVDPFSGKASRILAELLDSPNREWRLKDLAEEAGVSIGLTSMVRSSLAEKGYIMPAHGENRLIRPTELLTEWRERYSPRREASRYFTLEPLEKVERLLSEQGAVLTEFSAADRYAPYTRYQRIAAYAPHIDKFDAKDLSLRMGDTGANVTLYSEDPPVGKVHERDGLRVVSSVQACLDLTALGGRGVDAADFLAETYILRRWREPK